MAKQGQIRVETDDIFPIIRKWLYEDHDIFLREIVSNAADAISKLDRLNQLGDLGDYSMPVGDEPRIDVVFDSEDHSVTVSDNGIGMTEEEIERYINQIAFSGAVDFANKYKESGDVSQGIIGHFGLGFYSSFMVSDRVTIDSLSWRQGAEAARWSSEDGTTFTLEKGERTTRGTTITMYLDEPSREAFDANRLRQILRHYCLFMPWPIYFRDVQGDLEAENLRLEQDKKAVQEAKDSNEETPEPTPAPEIKAINSTDPLWLKRPAEVTEEEYREFYRETFNDYREPLFWIHLKMDYPIHLNGILYFPQKEERYETFDGRIKLFYNQVFVADDIKEIIPDYLMLLKGCIDSPDLPLNVSRSALQDEPEIKRLSSYIVRKVADQLTDMFKKERETYNKSWNDLSFFVRYGSLRDSKFLDRVQSALLFKTYDGDYLSLDELPEEVIYTTDPGRQVSYIMRAKQQGKTVIVMDDELDIPFLNLLEGQEKIETKFSRVDAQVDGEESDTELKATLEPIFQDIVSPAKLKISAKSLGSDEEAAVLIEDEQARNMLDMQKQFAVMQGQGEMNLEEMFPVERTLVLNTDSKLTHQIAELDEGGVEEAKKLAQQVYDLARLGHGSLEGNDLVEFLRRTREFMMEG